MGGGKSEPSAGLRQGQRKFDFLSEYDHSGDARHNRIVSGVGESESNDPQGMKPPSPEHRFCGPNLKINGLGEPFRHDGEVDLCSSGSSTSKLLLLKLGLPRFKSVLDITLAG